jgi:insecticidal toxin complex protein TccC
VYLDYQGKRVRTATATESNQQVQSQRDYPPSLDLSINQVKQQSSTLHIGTHILSENIKDNATSGLIHLVSQGARYLAP